MQKPNDFNSRVKVKAKEISLPGLTLKKYFYPEKFTEKDEVLLEECYQKAVKRNKGRQK